ncbi:hypothetical protein [Pseudoponticoccus marisrubri]|uniref:Protein NnrT n=1 Tax=Pseudoponticoccus marisrubri TaxID=1685382 RepID=A0A0W7WI86_9RHOB|nr:hypothetical protein [Pseudoponticoccus marisrubri]KUF10331.1 hypothetical protein AVJ23_13075 [Pseudoponticoccus marisrubri]
MTRIPLAALCLAALPRPALAEAFARPIPQQQTDTAEFWFLIGSIGLLVALAAVQWLVSRR